MKYLAICFEDSFFCTTFAAEFPTTNEKDSDFSLLVAGLSGI
jgi:hypothetical protein